MEDLGAICNIVSGSIMLLLGSFNHSQNNRGQDSRSSDALKATAFAENVDLTTRGIFFELHAIGQTIPT